jgi:hypothetical protein
MLKNMASTFKKTYYISVIRVRKVMNTSETITVSSDIQEKLIILSVREMPICRTLKQAYIYCHYPLKS